MKYHQKDIVEVSFLFPDGTFKPHPAIIVSNDQLQEDEDGMFYLVLTPSNDFRMNILNATRNSSRLWLFLDISCIITLIYVIFVRFVGGKDAILVKHL